MNRDQDLKWSKGEKTRARKAFDKAYAREMKQIKERVRSILASDRDDRVVWKVHDYLSEKRNETDEKYDYRYSVIIRVFGVLMAEGLLHEEDLEGLGEEKMERIRWLAKALRES